MPALPVEVASLLLPLQTQETLCTPGSAGIFAGIVLFGFVPLFLRLLLVSSSLHGQAAGLPRYESAGMPALPTAGSICRHAGSMFSELHPQHRETPVQKS